MKYAFIAEHQAEFPIQRMCRVWGVQRSGYYAWRRRKPSARAQANDVLVEQICAEHATSRNTYGSPRIRVSLRRKGVVRGKNRDFTYIDTAEGWLYLAAVFDVFSRKVIGWAMSEQMDAALVEAAWQMARLGRQPAPGLLHHSDQGSQYTSVAYQQCLVAADTQASMSRVGNCYNNAVMESFFATLKTECVTAPFDIQALARTTIFEYIEVWYNRQRLHSTLGYLSSVEFERSSRH